MFDATVLNVSNILHIDKWEISSNPTVPQVPTDSFWTTLTNFFSLHSWRYCLSARLKFCWQSRDLKKGVGTRHLTYCLPENPGILNSPHTIVRRNWIGRGPYICQSRLTIFRNFAKGADGKLLGNIMADSAELSIDKALEDLNVSKEKQKIILIGSRKQLWMNFLLDVMLWQFCPQGSAKAKLRITLDCLIVKEIATVFLLREGGRLCFIVTSEAEENNSY